MKRLQGSVGTHEFYRSSSIQQEICMNMIKKKLAFQGLNVLRETIVACYDKCERLFL